MATDRTWEVRMQPLGGMVTPRGLNFLEPWCRVPEFESFKKHILLGDQYIQVLLYTLHKSNRGLFIESIHTICYHTIRLGVASAPCLYPSVCSASWTRILAIQDDAFEGRYLVCPIERTRLKVAHRGVCDSGHSNEAAKHGGTNGSTISTIRSLSWRDWMGRNSETGV